MNDVTKLLINLKDDKNADFVAKLTPNVEKERILGVKVPTLRQIAKSLYASCDYKNFLSATPHYYLEENSLHLFILGYEKDFDKAVRAVDKFLPYVDNWGTCDGFSSLTFKKNTDKLTPYIDKWLKSKQTFTIRFGISMLLKYYLDENFTPDVLEKAAKIYSDEYYVNMMIAWFFATALCKQRDLAIKYIENKTLSPFCHNKTIQKARESFRISAPDKEYLKSLKV